MRKLYSLLLIVIFIAINSCGNKKPGVGGIDITVDGIYCADVTYYNPNTGTKSTYQLNVELEEGELIKIFWPNGGWLDEDHFSNVTFDDDGEAEFTSDKGYNYTISLNGPECPFNDSNKMEREVKLDESSVTCAKCGNSKSNDESVCSDCKEKICPQCRGRKYSSDEVCSNCEDENADEICPECGFSKFSFDDYCSSCERKLKCPKCGGQKSQYDNFCSSCENDR